MKHLNHDHKQLPKKWPTVYRISKQIDKKIIQTNFHRENDFWTRVNKCKNAALKHANNPAALHNSYANYSLVSFSPPIGRGGRLVLAVKCQVCDVFPRFVLGCRNQLFLIKVWQHLFTLNYVWFTEELLIDITRMHHMRTSEIEQKVRICSFFGWPDGLSRQQKSTGLLMRKWHEHNDITLTRDPFVS